MKQVQICGGGLAGLTLGILLRQAGVPVTVTEAGEYPRHKVCGEFISGAGQQVLQKLGLDEICSDAAVNRSTAWLDGSKLLYETDLPIPAIGLSRLKLDAGLARRFEDLDGKLITGKRIRPPSDGSVQACGRTGSSRDAIGLKLHCRGLDQKHDLSMHLGRGGYVGVSRIENDRWNICGLFRLRRGISPGKEKMLPAYLRASGLNHFADSLATAEIDPDSISATTQLQFGRGKCPAGSVCIGDHAAAIPPFAGNGMSIAFESAELAFSPLLAYSAGEKTWNQICEELNDSMRKKFRFRLQAARMLHPFLLQPRLHPIAVKMLSLRLLPFHLAYRVLR